MRVFRVRLFFYLFWGRFWDARDKSAGVLSGRGECICNL